MALDRRSLGIIISRVLGIVVLILAIQFFPLLSSMFAEAGHDRALFTVVITIVFFLNLGISYVLLLHAPRVATFLVSQTAIDDDSSTMLDAETVTSTAFIIIGMMLVVRGLPTAAEQIVLRLSGVKSGPASDALLVGLAVQALIGLYLIIDRKGLVRLIGRIRGEDSEP